MFWFTYLKLNKSLSDLWVITLWGHNNNQLERTKPHWTEPNTHPMTAHTLTPQWLKHSPHDGSHTHPMMAHTLTPRCRPGSRTECLGVHLRLQGVHQYYSKTSYPASVQTSLFTQAFLPVDRQALLGSSTDMLGQKHLLCLKDGITSCLVVWRTFQLQH